MDALEEVHKQLNVKRGVDSYKQAFSRIHQAGIAVLSAFIFGMDGDNSERLRRRADYMIRSGVDVMQTTFLTPLPGTLLFDRYHREGRLLYNNFPERLSLSPKMFIRRILSNCSKGFTPG